MNTFNNLKEDNDTHKEVSVEILLQKLGFFFFIFE
jgi:hypothetical protein